MNTMMICVLALQTSPAPEPVRVSRLDFAKFDQFVAEGQKVFGVPGVSYALVKDGKIVHRGAVGVKQAGKPEPVDANTVYQIGSISKSFTAVLNGIAIDDGKFNWNTRVVDIDPTFMMSDPGVTREFIVADTMAQRSGQKPYATDFLSMLGMSRQQIRAAMAHTPLVMNFRADFGYVNNMWLQAARLSEVAYGDSWDELIQTKILGPLRMSDSSTTLDGLFDAPNHAIMHSPGPNGPIPLTRDWPFGEWPYIYGPAGGINSNVIDMTNYLLMHMQEGRFQNVRLLKPETVDTLHAPHTVIPFRSSMPTAASVGRSFYAQGLVHSIKDEYSVIWHNGGTTGCKAMMGFSPQLNAGIVVLSNLGGNYLPEAMMYRWLDMVAGVPDHDYLAEFKALQEGLVVKPSVRPANPAPPMELSAYTGEFVSEIVGEIEVAAKNGRLWLRVPPKFHPMYLEPWNRDAFRLRIPGFADESEDYGFVTFTISPDGKAESFALDILESGGNNLLRRKE